MFQPFVWQKVAPVLQKSLYPNDFVMFAVLNHSDKKLTMISLFQSDDGWKSGFPSTFRVHHFWADRILEYEYYAFIYKNLICWWINIEVFFSQILGASHSKFSIGQPLEVNGLKFQNHSCYS